MMKSLYVRPALIAALLLVSACAPYPGPQAIGPPDGPRASWSIRAGDSLNERDICRSDIDQPCVIPASSEKQPVSVVVSVYVHPVGDAKTTYQGVVAASFISTANATLYERQVDVTIEPGRRPTGITVAGLAPSNPGRHYFRIALLASVPMRTDPHHFEETIPVEVVGPGA